MPEGAPGGEHLERLRLENHLLKQIVRQLTGWYPGWDDTGRLYATRDQKLTSAEVDAGVLRTVQADTAAQLVSAIRRELNKIIATSCAR
ncbi:hypothetical protein EBO15_11955 [Actinomadura harenae]|uniref:Uncharacterized protein n=1 Tax=Actinomadura harenae TaxID=2483351 RepID=A0A3M2M4R9_9ACTN|nr:hypothetical protein EBO15_11955 [Actinomadura harenae]